MLAAERQAMIVELIKENGSVQVDELAKELSMDPSALREKNMVREGDVMPAYYGETARRRCGRETRDCL